MIHIYLAGMCIYLLVRDLPARAFDGWSFTTCMRIVGCMYQYSTMPCYMRSSDEEMGLLLLSLPSDNVQHELQRWSPINIPREETMQRIKEMKGCLHTKTESLLYLLPAYLRSAMKRWVYYLCHPTFAVWTSTLITHEHSQRENTAKNKRKDASLRRLTPLLYLLPAYLRSNPAVLVLPFLLHTPLPSLLHPHAASILHPHAMGMGLSSLTPWFLLACWRSQSCSLKRDSRLEMATCVVTEAICKRRSFNTPFLAMNPPSLPLTGC